MGNRRLVCATTIPFIRQIYPESSTKKILKIDDPCAQGIRIKKEVSLK